MGFLFIFYRKNQSISNPLNTQNLLDFGDQGGVEEGGVIDLMDFGNDQSTEGEQDGLNLAGEVGQGSGFNLMDFGSEAPQKPLEVQNTQPIVSQSIEVNPGLLLLGDSSTQGAGVGGAPVLQENNFGARSLPENPKDPFAFVNGHIHQEKPKKTRSQAAFGFLNSNTKTQNRAQSNGLLGSLAVLSPNSAPIQTQQTHQKVEKIEKKATKITYFKPAPQQPSKSIEVNEPIDMGVLDLDLNSLIPKNRKLEEKKKEKEDSVQYFQNQRQADHSQKKETGLLGEEPFGFLNEINQNGVKIQANEPLKTQNLYDSGRSQPAVQPQSRAFGGSVGFDFLKKKEEKVVISAPTQSDQAAKAENNGFNFLGGFGEKKKAQTSDPLNLLGFEEPANQGISLQEEPTEELIFVQENESQKKSNDNINPFGFMANKSGPKKTQTQRKDQKEAQTQPKNPFSFLKKQAEKPIKKEAAEPNSTKNPFNFISKPKNERKPAVLAKPKKNAAFGFLSTPAKPASPEVKKGILFDLIEQSSLQEPQNDLMELDNDLSGGLDLFDLSGAQIDNITPLTTKSVEKSQNGFDFLNKKSENEKNQKTEILGQNQDLSGNGLLEGLGIDLGSTGNQEDQPQKIFTVSGMRKPLNLNQTVSETKEDRFKAFEVLSRQRYPVNGMNRYHQQGYVQNPHRVWN